MTNVTGFKVMRGAVTIDSFTTRQWGTAKLALEKARAKQDQLNAASDMEPCCIVLCYRLNTAKQL